MNNPNEPGTAARHTARAIAVDDCGHLVLVKRSRPGTPVYWTAPGGAIEPGESSVDALRRELAEELGATLVSAWPVLQLTTTSRAGTAVHHIHAATVTGIDTTARTGRNSMTPPVAATSWTASS